VRTRLDPMALALSLALALTLTLAGPVRAQIFTPTYQSPRLVNELGLTISDGPGRLAFEGLWRGGPLGLRVGYAEAGDGVLLVGGEVRSPIAIAGAPLGLAFTAGAQGLIGDDDAFGAQAGLSAGYSFMAPGLAITPYIHPRIGAVRDRRESDLKLRALADVGADVEFHTNLLVRLGVALDDIGASWGFGLGWRR
jgi:hypothetical protein